MEDTIHQAQHIYQQYVSTVNFIEIEHVPDQFIPTEIARE